MVPPAPFLQRKPSLTPGLLGVLAVSSIIDEELRKAWLPFFCTSGRRDANLEEFSNVLADVVRREGAIAGSLDGWRWRDMKVLSVTWFDGFSKILTTIEDNCV